MAITSMASYPHIEINVIDESIYQYSNTRILPLQRDLFTVRAQKGRVGVLAWYDQFAEAETALGSETFNNLNAKYCSNDSIFIKRVMENNGCFIVRLAEPESLAKPNKVTHDGISERLGSLKALQILEAVVDSGTDYAGTPVVVYERNSDGSIMTDEDGDPIEYKVDAQGNHIPPYNLDEITGERVDSTATSPDNTAWNAIGDDEYASEGVKGVKRTNGITIDWRWRYAFRPASVTQSERESIKNMKAYTQGTSTVYPMLVFEASSPGCWGNDNCLEFFYDSSNNSRDEAQLLGNVVYTLKPHYKVYGESTVNSYFDKRGNNAVNFVMEPDKIDSRYESMVSIIDVLDDSYDEVNPLPWDVTYFNENWEEVGKLARKFELAYYKELYDSADTEGTIPAYVDANGRLAGDTFTNAAGDGIADADMDGVAGVDRFIDDLGEDLDKTDMTSEQLQAFRDQTAYYNAINDMANPWMMNIVSGINLDGNPYYTVSVNKSALTNPAAPSEDLTEAQAAKFKNDDGTILHTYAQWESAELVSDVLHYALNGRDGDLSDWGHEARIRQFYGLTYQYESTWNPKNIVDRGRFPFNTIFDTGYTLDTKKALCSFLTVREDVKIILSTQNCNQYLKDPTKAATKDNIMDPKFNTMAQDESVGTALQSRVQLMRESVVKGTACCRATIFAHAGHLYGTYKRIVPMTLWLAIRGSEHYNTVSMNGTCKGWPNSQVDIFKDLNWVAPDEASHERHWNLGINYVQYYDMDNLHFPSIRTVYKYDTSVLLDDEFTDAIVFVKQAARDSWATYVGMDTPQTIYEALITKDLSARLLQIFNGRYTFDVQAYQTVEEANRGYVQHVAITITAPAVKRVWLVDVICRREGFDPTAQANA